MSDSNPFHVVFAIAAIIIFVTGITAVIAPSFGVNVPAMPAFPSLHTPSASSSSVSGSSVSNSGNGSSGGWIDRSGRLIVDAGGNVVASESGRVIYGSHYGAQASWINDSGAFPLFQIDFNGQVEASSSSS